MPAEQHFTAAQLQRLVVALQRWVDQHPEPDADALKAENRSYSARDVSQAVAQAAAARGGSEKGPLCDLGEAIISIIEYGLTVEPFAKIVARFERPPQEPPSASLD